MRETSSLVGDCLVVVGDHANEDDASRMVAESVAALGRLDVLVNNAGEIRRNVPVHEVSAELWDAQVRSNLRGPFLMAREALRVMVTAPGGDRAIVNVSSTLAHAGSPGVAAYGAARPGCWR